MLHLRADELFKDKSALRFSATFSFYFLIFCCCACAFFPRPGCHPGPFGAFPECAVNHKSVNAPTTTTTTTSMPARLHTNYRCKSHLIENNLKWYRSLPPSTSTSICSSDSDSLRHVAGLSLRLRLSLRLSVSVSQCCCRQVALFYFAFTCTKGPNHVHTLLPLRANCLCWPIKDINQIASVQSAQFSIQQAPLWRTFHFIFSQKRNAFQFFIRVSLSISLHWNAAQLGMDPFGEYHACR